MAAGYAEQLLGRVSSLVQTCTRRVSRATRRLLRHRKKPAAALCARGAAIDKKGSEVALWSRRILMGERCQPLDFVGAIHYDSFGRRLARPPTPRSASSLSCRSSGSAAASDEDASYLENADA
ncbi:hypothetical protein GQ55_3G149600 [Panicum hallii var. hallii]|jgi:hypothetical protein|uniref:Uncharacterized protein n=2 Tax=Panicum hallii TaxID=206008 RepID=A0A2T7E9M1_9POAL|nr:uncharacterized protein LOC112885159 [Panicum hallii]PUZ64526.1 hypothetical protein GQ55_3G149600 [Panicum hallii var. hallii]PVH61920.1 hypothetical protein PAHAL_3G157800 [Panicum hallii]